MRLADDNVTRGFDEKQQDISPSQAVERGRSGRPLWGEVLQLVAQGLLLFALLVDGANSCPRKTSFGGLSGCALRLRNAPKRRPDVPRNARRSWRSVSALAAHCQANQLRAQIPSANIAEPAAMRRKSPSREEVLSRS
jgi:hypothetical protein